MEVILLKDMKGLGRSGDIITVKPGFARNKLIPEGVALRASKRNLAVSEERKKISEIKKKRENAAAHNLVTKISKPEITIEAQVGEDEKMFGSVTAKDIQRALAEKDISIDRNSVLLDEQIRALGIYHVPIKISSNINGDLKVYVIKA